MVGETITEQIDVEGSFLSILIFSEIKQGEVTEALKSVAPQMLLRPDYREIYTIFSEMCDTEDIEIVGTEQFSKKLKLIAEIQHFELLGTLTDIELNWTPTKTLPYYIKQIQEKYFSYRYFNATSKKEYKEIEQEELRYAVTDEMEDISEDTDNITKEYEIRKDTKITTPYSKINDIIGSLQGGDMIILAGATGGGKTCFMLNLAIGMAKDGHNVDIFSLEMPKSQLQQRIICHEADIDASKFRKFCLNAEDWARFYNYANNGFKKLPIRIYKYQTVTVDLIKKIELKSNADIVFIDYLGLIKLPQGQSRYAQVSEISRQIKLLAMESNKPIVCLHQLNREFMQRDDKKPRASDLRDSGQLEQDADFLWFVYRPSQFDDKAFKETMYFLCAKNRHGESNREVQLSFNGRKQSIVEALEV